MVKSVRYTSYKGNFEWERFFRKIRQIWTGKLWAMSLQCVCNPRDEDGDACGVPVLLIKQGSIEESADIMI